MSSFTTVIDNIVTTLQNDAPLDAFCKSKWGKPISVKKIFKKRAELSIQNLPKILITRPLTEKSFLINTSRESKNTVRLYCIFYQTDKRKALNELIEFEEKIDDAILMQSSETLGAISINPKGSENDEGEWHPVYAIVMDVEIQHRR